MIKKFLFDGLFKIPTDGRCPKCGSSLEARITLSGFKIVCKNPLCSYEEKGKNTYFQGNKKNKG
ncbi:hypothetical protein [Desulfurobacterium atlanticum]|uniref:Uncharacterized protein n=1 Tax=Desulfurobacterium atlanticum TaxID=240169 RepID=A0A239A4M5_9BACT|nr:hypothetical protein [Desulfurobacterium atlanticum]SNR90616.1 hypothetical protein SAMN06265340_11526 [Desulfurobacterium atlanticum]